MMYHVPLKLGSDVKLPLMISDGYLWVFFYFMISGFLSAYSYKGQEINPFKFVMRKVSKIYPIYLLSLILIFFSIGKILKPIDYIAPLFLVQTWLIRYLPFSDPGWYLSALMFLNFCFPFLIEEGTKNMKVFIILNALLVLFTAFFVNKFLAIHAANNYKIKELYYLVTFFPPIMLGAFMSGISIFFLSSKLEKSEIYSFLLIIWFILACIFLPKRNYILSILVFIPIVLFTALDTGWLSKFSSKPIFKYLAELSFPIYILHMPLVYVVKHIHGNFTNSNKIIALYYILVIVISAIVLYFEKKNLLFRFGKTLKKASND